MVVLDNGVDENVEHRQKFYFPYSGSVDYKTADDEEEDSDDDKTADDEEEEGSDDYKMMMKKKSTEQEGVGAHCWNQRRYKETSAGRVLLKGPMMMRKIRTHTPKHTYIHTHTHTHIHVYIYMCVCIYLHVCVCSCVYIARSF